MKDERSIKTKALLNNSGQTIVIVVVIMLVFILLGISVLSAAAGTASTQARRAVDTQTYYYASSILDTLDSGLRGSLGDRILRSALAKAGGNGSSAVTGSETADLYLGGDTMIGELALEYTGTVNRENNTAAVSITSITVSPTAEYQGGKYSFTANYKLTAEASRNGNSWSIGEKTCTLISLK